MVWDGYLRLLSTRAFHLSKICVSERAHQFKLKVQEWKNKTFNVSVEWHASSSTEDQPPATVMSTVSHSMYNVQPFESLRALRPDLDSWSEGLAPASYMTAKYTVPGVQEEAIKNVSAYSVIFI